MPRSFVTLASAVLPTTAERQAVARNALVRAGTLFPKILQEGSMFSTKKAIWQANTIEIIELGRFHSRIWSVVNWELY